MGGLKIGGIYYGGDVQKAMEKANVIVMDSAKKVYWDDDLTINTIKVALECYEKAFLERLKNDKGSTKKSI